MTNLSDFFDTPGFSMSESEEESPGVLKEIFHSFGKGTLAENGNLSGQVA